MSYCRFSSDNFGCDVYVYASGGGIVTHVAARRHIFDRTGLLLLDDVEDNSDEFWERYFANHKEVMKRVDEAELVDIDHPEAGETFVHETPAEAADNLERLRSEGFVVPQYAIDSLREEASENWSDEVYGYEACWSEEDGKHCRKPKGHEDECARF